jgi:hypothetical protein
MKEKKLRKYGNSNIFLLFIVILLMNMGQVMAQSSEKEKHSRVGASLGYSFSGYLEQTVLPVNRYCNTFTYLVDGNIEKGNFYHTFNLSLFSGKVDAIKADSDNAYFSYYQKEATFTRAYLEYALDYRLWGNQFFPGYLGGTLRGDYYGEMLKETLFSNHTGIFSLNVHVTQKWIINAENEFAFSAGFPIFGYAFRPSYFALLGLVEQGITSLHNYWAIFGDLKYRHKINTLLSLHSGLGFELSHIDFPQPRKDALFRLYTGISFTF